MITPDMTLDDIPLAWREQHKRVFVRMRNCLMWDYDSLEPPTVMELFTLSLDPEWRREKLRTPNFSIKSMACLDALFEDAGLRAHPVRLNIPEANAVLGFGG